MRAHPITRMLSERNAKIVSNRDSNLHTFSATTSVPEMAGQPLAKLDRTSYNFFVERPDSSTVANNSPSSPATWPVSVAVGS